VRFQIGQDQSSVMKEISARFTVVPVTGQPDTFFLRDSNQRNGQILGGVTFKGGKISWIQRSWGSFSGQSKAADAVNALFAAVESASSVAGTTARISTKTQRVPDIEFKAVTLDFGQRKVTIMLSDATPEAGGKGVSITESVHDQ
jgi:hypothetical protein